jgi:hypothetical protein
MNILEKIRNKIRAGKKKGMSPFAVIVNKKHQIDLNNFDEVSLVMGIPTELYGVPLFFSKNNEKSKVLFTYKDDEYKSKYPLATTVEEL